MAELSSRSAIYVDLEAVPPHLVAEIIDGELVTRLVGAPRDASQRVLETFKLQDSEWQLTHRFGPGDVISVDPFADTRFELNDLWPQLGGPSVTTTH